MGATNFSRAFKLRGQLSTGGPILSLLKSLPTSGRGYRFLIIILFRRLRSTYSYIIPSTFSIKRIGALVGNLLGLT